MAIGPRNKVTTTGMMDKTSFTPVAADMSALQPPQQVQPTQAGVTPPVPQEGPLTTKYPGVNDLSDEDIESLNAALSPSVKTALSKIFPDLASTIDQLGTDEPNVIFPLSIVKRFAMQRYGGQDENEAVQNFLADVISPDIQQAQMEQPNNVPPGTEEPTQTAGLMSSPQNMETV
mgnify:CR=1 FL=1